MAFSGGQGTLSSFLFNVALGMGFGCINVLQYGVVGAEVLCFFSGSSNDVLEVGSRGPFSKTNQSDRQPSLAHSKHLLFSAEAPGPGPDLQPPGPPERRGWAKAEAAASGAVARR